MLQSNPKFLNLPSNLLEKELDEPPSSELDSNNLAVNVCLSVIPPENKKEFSNPFKSPEYWHMKGWKLQTGRSSRDNLTGNFE